VLLTVTACAQGGERQPAQESRTQAQAPSSSAPATTVIDGQQVSLKEVESIEGAVRKYFDAFLSADFKGLATHSTGELKVLAGWQRILNGESTGLGALKPAAATVEDLKVVSVRGNTATVEIKGQLDETASVIEGNRGEDRLLSTSIDGAVRLVRGTTWQAVDFHRGGRWAREQVYIRVRGQRSGQGVVVKVVGVDLRPKGTVVMMELRNTTGLEAGAGGTVVRDASGKRLQIALGRDLVDVNLGCNPVCKVGTSMDIPVRLLG
jgi:hypothetical protein